MAPKRIPNAYSIWLIPNDEKYIILKNIIAELSPIFEGINFAPHVTLISNLNYSENFLSKKIEKIAKKVKPFNIYLNEIDYLNEFFRSFFINVKINKDLASIRKIAQSHFPTITEKYKPHLSLAYGKVESTIKKKIKNKIHCPIKNFKVKELYLAHNDEINYKWKVIKQFPILK